MINISDVTSKRLKELKATLPDLLLKKQFEIQPELKTRYGQREIGLYLEDTRYHLSYLSESIATNEPVFFNEYLAWAKAFFANLDVSDEEIILNLELLRDELQKELTTEMFEIASSYITKGIEYYNNYDPNIPTYIKEDNPLANVAKEYLDFLVEGNKHPAQNLILEAVKRGTSIKDIYLNVFQVTQRETGRLWQRSEISVAQEHYITAATQLIMSRLYPYLFTSTTPKRNKIVISCIAGELHEMGARMVADLFELEGWDTYFYGANTPQSALLGALKQHKPEVAALSVTMTFNLITLSEIVQKIKSDPETKDIKVLVGGYPFTISDTLGIKMGADGCGTDALKAIKVATELVKAD